MSSERRLSIVDQGREGRGERRSHCTSRISTHIIDRLCVAILTITAGIIVSSAEMDILYKFLSHTSARHASTSTPLTPASSEYDSSSAASGSKSTTSSTLDSTSIQDEQDEPRLLVSPAEKFAARVRCARESDFPTLRGKPLVCCTSNLKHKSHLLICSNDSCLDLGFTKKLSQT